MAGLPSLGYLGSQDTAMAASRGALGWRGLDWDHAGQQEGDGFKAAVAPGSDAGMKVAHLPGQRFSVHRGHWHARAGRLA